MQFGCGLKELIAVGADGDDRHDVQVGRLVRHQVSEDREELTGLCAGLGAEQLFGLIHRKDHGRRGRRHAVDEALHRRPLRFGQPAAHESGIIDAGLDNAQVRFIQAQLGSQRIDRLRQAHVAGQRVTLRTHDAHRQEVPVVAP